MKAERNSFYIKIVVFYLSSLLMIGCTGKEKKHVFNYVDYSYYSTWVGFYSIKIENCGNTEMYLNHHNKGKFFIRTKLAPLVMDSLKNLVKNINWIDIDSLYSKDCSDCGYFNLVLETPENKFNTFVESLNNNDPKLENIIKLSDYMQYIMSDTLNAVNSAKFESKTDAFYPSSPPSPLD